MFFADAYDKRSLDDRCFAYWTKFLKRLAKSLDGYLLLEQSCQNANRVEWQEGKRPIRVLYRSKRFVPHVDVFGRILEWLAGHGSSDSVAIIGVADILAPLCRSFYFHFHLLLIISLFNVHLCLEGCPFRTFRSEDK